MRGAARRGGARVPGADVTEQSLVVGAAAGAAGLAISSTGSIVVAAVLFGVATRNRWSMMAALFAVASVAVRFSTVGLDDLAGIQSVLGAAGVVGPPAAAAGAWCAAVALVLAAGSRDRAPLVERGLVALAAGAIAATVVAGPGPGDEIAVRVATTSVATVLALLVADGRARHARRLDALAVVMGVAAVVLAGWPS